MPNFWKLGRYSSMKELGLQWMKYTLRLFHEDFKYIGSMKSADGNCNNDMKSRIGMGKKRMLDTPYGSGLERHIFMN